jgi:hypothetical protein
MNIENLQIPAMCYGTYAEVKKKSIKAVNAFIKGGSLLATVKAEGLIDVANSDGLIVLSGPSPLLNKSAHFYIFLPLMLAISIILQQNLPQNYNEVLYDEFSQTPWGILALLSPGALPILDRANKDNQFIDRVKKYWSVLQTVGDKYTTGLPEGRALWKTPSNLHVVLARLGVEKAVLNAELPPKGIFKT